MTEFTDADMSAIESAVRQAKARYKRFVEIDDLRQECWVWLLENQARVIEWRDRLDEKVAQQTLIKAMRNACSKYGREEANQKAGRSQPDETYYSLPVMVNLLRLYLSPQLVPDDNVSLSGIVAQVGFTFENTFSDTDKEYLRSAYASGDIKENIVRLAEEWEVTYEAARLRIARRVARLCDRIEDRYAYTNSAMEKA